MKKLEVDYQSLQKQLDDMLPKYQMYTELSKRNSTLT
jgi:hypothetical protein